jgi:histidinol-phosphate/aromatic aminotransferase/cobyric acid decarboxylase-like protein
MDYTQAVQKWKDAQAAHISAGAAVFTLTEQSSPAERAAIKERLLKANIAVRQCEQWFFTNYGREYWDEKRRVASGANDQGDAQ